MTTKIKAVKGFAIALLLASIVMSPFFEQGSYGASEMIWKGNDSSSNVLVNVSDVPIHTHQNTGPRRTILQSKSDLYLLTSWMNGSTLTLSLLTSNDNGTNWNSPIDIWFDNTDLDIISLPSLGLHIWKGKLYVFFRIASEFRGDAKLFCKYAPLDDLGILGTMETVTVHDYEANKFDVAHDDDNLYIAYSSQGEYEAYFRKFDGTTWSPQMKVVGRGLAASVDIEVVKEDGKNKLLYFYTRWNDPSYDTGNVMLITSTTMGVSWSTPSRIMDRSDSYHVLDVEYANDTLFLFAAEKYDDPIDITVSDDHGKTWSSERRLVDNRGRNPTGDYQPGHFDFSVSASEDGKDLRLAYEGADEKIKMIRSTDGGSEWTQEEDALVQAGSGSYNPSLSPDGSLLSYLKVDSVTGYSFQELIWTNISSSEPREYGPIILSSDVKTAKVNSSYSNTYSAIDQDTDRSELEWSLETNATWLSLTNGSTLKGIPVKSGQFWVNISVTDGVYIDFSNFTISVEGAKTNASTNDTVYPEYYDDPLAISLPEDEEGFTIDITTQFDDLDGFELVEINGSNNVMVINTLGSIYLIRPAVNWAGSETITLLLEKDGVRIERDLEVTVVNRNDPPKPPTLYIPENLLEGEQYQFNATAEDPDLPYGDSLELTWYMGDHQILGSGDSILTDLPAGTYFIRVVVEDSHGETSEGFIEVTVLPNEKESADDDNEGSFPVMVLILLSAVITIILGTMITLIFILRNRSMREKEEDLVSYPDSIGPMDYAPGNIKQGPFQNSPSGIMVGNIDHADMDQNAFGSYGKIKEDLLQGNGKWLKQKDLKGSVKSLRDQGRISQETYEIILERMTDD